MTRETERQIPGELQIATGNRDTWPKLLLHNAQTFGNRRKAIRFKHYGIWRSYTWKDYYLEVKHLALGLLSLGFQPGDRLLIVGDNAPQWYCAQLAAQANHGISVGAYSDLSPDELRHIGRTSSCSFAVVEDQEQVDKLLEIKGDLPDLTRVVYWGYKGLASYKDPSLIGYREVLELGRKRDSSLEEAFERNVATGKAEDACAVVFTAGTTGSAPKPALHTFATLRTGADQYDSLCPWRHTDEFVPHLTPAWIHGQYTAVGCHLLSGCVLNFVEKPETHQRDMREIGPSIVLFTARVWESLAAEMQARIEAVDALKKMALRLFMPLSAKRADRLLHGRSMGGAAKIGYTLANLIVLRRIRKSLGLSHTRVCYSTDALLSPESVAFYVGLSVPLRVVYGTTEGGLLAGTPSDGARSGMVGPVIPGVEARITDQGEIIYRHPGVFPGYYEDSGLTEKTLKDGWFYSGDLGSMEEGQIKFTDRLDCLVRLPSGETLAPQAVECRLRYSPHIRDAWVFGGTHTENVAAAIVINYDNVGRWASQNRVSFNSFAELSQKAEVYDLIRGDIDSVNRTLSAGLRIRRFVILNREFDPDLGEVTRTRKLRRDALTERFRALVDAVCSGKGHASAGGGDEGPLLTVESTGGAEE